MAATGERPPSTSAPAPVVETLLRGGAEARVVRLLLPQGSVIRKEPIGPGRERRLRRERAVLEALAGVPGTVHLSSALPQPPDALLLEDIHGEPLAARRMPLGVPEAVRLARALARTLAAVHARGVVHRDVNPTNIVLTRPTGQPCLVNFSHATMFTESRPQFAHHNEIVGTLAYVAPEQTGRTARPVDQRADLYALGATLYEMVTGAPPFGTGDPVRLIRDQLATVPVPPHELNPAVDRALSDIIMHLLEKEPDDRYQTGEGLLYDLRTVDSGTSRAGFRAGEHDLPVRPLTPSRLVGREREVAALELAFANAIAGRQRGILIGGPVGVGKTALMDELRRAVTVRDGWYLAGKSDQYRRDHGYDAVWQVFDGLAHMLLAEPDEVLAPLRQRLRETLGENAGLLAAILPAYGTVLQIEPDRVTHDPDTLAARLRRATVEVLAAVVSPKRPVVLALDDLQWTPRSSLAILDQIFSEESLEGLLVVGTYRQEDVDSTQALSAMLDRWQQLDSGVDQMWLGNLSAAGVASLLGDVLRLDAARARELATLLLPRTRGNPHHTLALVTSLRREGLIELGSDGWRWDPVALRYRLGQASVTELLAEQVEALPAATQQLLSTMACLGDRLALRPLRAATGLTPQEVDERLAPALVDRLLVMEHGYGEALRFRHDRVRDVVLRRLQPSELRDLHLAIARRLADVPELAHVAAEQYLPVLDALVDARERRRVTGLLQAAAEQAQLVGNDTLVEQMLAAAVRLVDPADVSRHVDLLTGHHAALYRLGRLAEADEVFAHIDRLCRTPVRRTAATLVQVSSLTNRNRHREAVRLGFDLLRDLGCPPPPADRLDTEVEQGLAAVREWLGDRDAPADTGHPEITDPTLLAIGRALDRLLPPTYFSDQLEHAWLAVQAWRIWRDHGPSRALVAPLCQLGMVAAVRREHRAGLRLMRRVVAESEARGYQPETAHAQFLYALGGWGAEPLEECVRLARQAREHLARGGDVQTACFTYYVTAPGLLDIAPLETHAAEVDAGTAMARRTGSDQVEETLELFGRLAAVLRGTAGPAGIASIGDPERYRANPAAVPTLHAVRALAAAVLGDATELREQTEATMAALPALSGTYLAAGAPVLRGLALAEQIRTAPGPDRDRSLAELDRIVESTAALAVDAPANFLHLARWLEAERAWAVGDFRGASYGFDAATGAAAGRTRPWHQALILERAAGFHLAHGLEHLGQRLLAEARAAYLAWGATAKVEQLDWAHPARPTVAAPTAEETLRVAGTTKELPALMPGTVDLAGVVAASQALSSQTSLDGLRERVVDVLRTMTGATAVHLLLRNEVDDTWALSVPRDGNGEGTLRLEEAGRGELVPMSVVRYVERTREPLVVGDATRDDRFRRDPYLSGVDTCSLLAVPVHHRGAMTALLILENRLIHDAFPPARLDAIILVAGQLGVSLHNAMVYASLERKVADRTEELAQANRRLERLSVTDALTGLANRRRFEDVLGREWERGSRSGAPVALLMLDIDRFKLYNDRYGHVAGDRCLRWVAAVLTQRLRDVDLVARFGGDEFAVVMPGAGLGAAVGAAERLRRAVEEAVGVEAGAPAGDDRLPVTVSIGVAAGVPTPGSGTEALTESADRQLYRAKQSGRNRVMPPPATVAPGAGRTASDRRPSQ